MKKKKLIYILAIVCSVFLLVVFLLSDPSDESMKAEFINKRQQFEDLYKMAMVDSHLWRVSNSWYREKNGKNYEEASPLLPAERWQNYRRAFKSLNMADGVSIEDGNVYFIRSTSGLAVSGSSQGFARLKEIPKEKELCENPVGVNAKSCYSPLGEGWYIFHDYR